ncbi:MAG: sulfite exporter TauE/SafE family protein [Bacteroidetes bacterium]|nr:sulfite exporter TauE/SafE family protein [Bacteroidota bacterium]
MLPLLTGIITSAVHVVTGPDHLAAVTPLAIENKHKAWSVGFLWGLGHVLGMLLIGVLFLLFKQLIPIEAISGHSELLVGIVLIIIGIWTFLKLRNKKHAHEHSHPHHHHNGDNYIHVHGHIHTADNGEHKHNHVKPLRQNNITAFLVGTLHGFAGVSHLILILPTLAFPTLFESVIYLTGFAIGTVGAMALFAVILGVLSSRTSLSHKAKWFTILRIAGASFAILIGIFWIIKSI